MKNSLRKRDRKKWSQNEKQQEIKGKRKEERKG